MYERDVTNCPLAQGKEADINEGEMSNAGYLS